MTNFNWVADTCQCKLVYDQTEAFVSCTQKCFLHKDIPDNEIWSTVLSHNHAHNETPEKADVEYTRIRQLGKPS